MRIKINTNRIARKLSAISCKLSAFIFHPLFVKNLPPTTYHLQPSPRNLQPTNYNPASSAGKPKPSPRNLPPTTYHLPPNRGFTLIELLVTLSLFVVLTTIVLFSQQKFNGSILLTNLAYDVALTVRQAQTYGINVREVSTDDFSRAYGVHFKTNTYDDKRTFLMFADSGGGSGGNGKYDGGDIEVNKYSIKRGNYISDICITSSGTEECEIKKLDITFLRPDPDALFRATKKDNNDANNITEAKIIISSANGDNRNVLVNSTGQISIGRGSGASCSTAITNPMTYNYTGSEQCYQVPNGVTSITVEVCGAQGTMGQTILGGGGAGGAAGKASGNLSVAGGDVLYVYVGGSGGYNGGGLGTAPRGGSGGGASDVRKGGSKIFVAGGGGGGGGADGQRGGGAGGNGGGYIGGDGYGGVAEMGGTSYGGAGGTDSYGGGGNLAGSSGFGGNAVTDRSGGGGGGYFGGGAGNRAGTSAGGGGGGGSSFVPVGGTTQSGVCSGNGYVTISY